MKNITIIGAGFAGLSAACFLAKQGHKVTVVEQHSIPGGRARFFESGGFRFDMGPSWYWMPDIIEKFFNQFGKSTTDYYNLQRLDPSYRIYYPDSMLDIPADFDQLKKLFESMEPGAGKMLDAFLKEAAFKYEVGMHRLVYKSGRSITEFFDWQLAEGLFRLDVFSSMQAHIKKIF